MSVLSENIWYVNEFLWDRVLRWKGDGVRGRRVGRGQRGKREKVEAGRGKEDEGKKR